MRGHDIELFRAQLADRVQRAAAAWAIAALDLDQHFIPRQVGWQGTVVAFRTSLASRPLLGGPGVDRTWPGLVGSKALLQIFQSQLQLLAAQLFGATAELVAQQTLDQQAQLVDLCITLTHRALQYRLLLLRRSDRLTQHLLQGLRVVRQGGEVDWHVGIMINAAESAPMTPA